MEIISHRGYWLKASEKNTVEAFKRSFSLGFGTETDVRDLAGTLVISHDPPKGEELTLDELLMLAGSAQPTLAINIKSDGLADTLKETMRRHDYKNWFVFDMSVPDTRGQLAAGNPTYLRISEFETESPMQPHAAGVWLDAFKSDEWRIEELRRLITANIKVCIVSPELHKRDHGDFWLLLKNSGLHNSDLVVLCTDIPEQAVDFFKVKA
ncbi:phosphodiesterase [Pseudomonas sp. Irchel s3b5]|uniref:phosphodiesterase n=1 Tax=Pseudomonas sp. Irchel s3b5 TaxID=2009077 RepID=UPI000BA426B8|nr:phosphodiesterase [Pseudomonas sp. Irchel s3b5]